MRKETISKFDVSTHKYYEAWICTFPAGIQPCVCVFVCASPLKYTKYMFCYVFFLFFARVFIQRYFLRVRAIFAIVSANITFSMVIYRMCYRAPHQKHQLCPNTHTHTDNARSSHMWKEQIKLSLSEELFAFIFLSRARTHSFFPSARERAPVPYILQQFFFGRFSFFFLFLLCSSAFYQYAMRMESCAKFIFWQQ